MTTVVAVARSVPFPAPVMSTERIRRLTPRERQVLDDLVAIFTSQGFAHLTMADLAAHLNCSLRTLYQLAGNKDDLFLIVIDRVAYAYGRSARDVLTDEMSAVEAVRHYLHAGHEMVDVYHGHEQLAIDVAAFPPAIARADTHVSYGVDVVKALLDLAVERGEIREINTGALARMLGGAAHDFSRPDVMPLLGTSPKSAANEMVDLVCDALIADAPLISAVRSKSR